MSKMKVLSTWKNCSACDLCGSPRLYIRTSSNTQPPVDALFIGDAPSDNDLVLKEPLVSLEGRLLQSVIDKIKVHIDFSYVITNSVICTPYTDETKTRIGKPTPKQMDSCFFHISDCIRLYQPLTVFGLGATVTRLLKKHSVVHTAVKHPAAVIIRGGEGSLDYKKFFLQIRRAVIDGKTKTSI